MSPQLTKILAMPSVPQPDHYIGEQSFVKAGGRVLVLKSKLDQDDDGISHPGITYATYHQGQTSLDPGATWIDAITVPYFVLPGHFPHGIGMGDIAYIEYQGKSVFAICADVGPQTKIGEASVAVHNALGFNNVRNGHIIDSGIDANVYTVLFPNSKIDTPCSFQAIQAAGQIQMNQLLGS